MLDLARSQLQNLRLRCGPLAELKWAVWAVLGTNALPARLNRVKVLMVICEAYVRSVWAKVMRVAL